SSATISVHRRLEEDRPVLVVEHEGGGTGHAGTLAAGSVQDRARSTLVLEAQPRRPVAVEAEARTTHAARVEENEGRGLVGDRAHDGGRHSLAIEERHPRAAIRAHAHLYALVALGVEQEDAARAVVQVAERRPLLAIGTVETELGAARAVPH